MILKAPTGRKYLNPTHIGPDDKPISFSPTGNLQAGILPSNHADSWTPQALKKPSILCRKCATEIGFDI